MLWVLPSTHAEALCLLCTVFSLKPIENSTKIISYTHCLILCLMHAIYRSRIYIQILLNWSFHLCYDRVCFYFFLVEKLGDNSHQKNWIYAYIYVNTIYIGFDCDETWAVVTAVYLHICLNGIIAVMRSRWLFIVFIEICFGCLATWGEQCNR